jgi:hypothetical protein
MSTDLNERLSGTLYQRAATGPAVDPALLLTSASAKGRRLRRRRRVWTTTGSALAATAAVAITVAALPGMRDRAVSQPAATASSSLAPRSALRMPPATGVPGALTRPDLVGTDPAVLHFSIDDLTAEATSVQWSAAKDLENAQFVAAESQTFMISVARRQKDLGASRTGSAPEMVVVNGAQGTLTTAKAGKRQLLTVTWQPVANLWAQATASGTSRDEALRMAETVRFDRTTRCAVPFRLESIPAGMAIRQCTVHLTDDASRPHLTEADLWVGDDERYAWFAVSPGTSPGFEPTMTVGPHRVLHTQETWVFADEPYIAQLSTAVGGNGPISNTEAQELIAGFRTVGEPNDPSTW